MIEIRCFHDLSEAQPFRDAMNALNLACVRPDPFSTFEFYENYLRNAELFPADGSPRLWLLLAFSEGRLVGYLALKQRLHRVLGLRAVKLDLMSDFVADRPHLVARSEHEKPVSAAIYAYLLSRKKEWSLVEFQQQDAASPLLPPPAEATSGICQFRQWPNLPNGTIPVRWSSVAAYFLHIVYDDRLARLGPGSAIFLMGVRLAIEGGYECFNLLRGFGYYKARWLAEMTETQSLQIYRIGTPFFWRRVLGDVRRRWFGKTESNDTALSNPARLELEKAEPAHSDASLARLASAQERERYATLIAQVRGGRGEFLSASALAAAMPFATQRRDNVHPPHHASHGDFPQSQVHAV